MRRKGIAAGVASLAILLSSFGTATAAEPTSETLWLTKPVVTASAAAQTTSLIVRTTDATWAAVAADSWVTVAPASGVSGDTVKISVAANTSVARASTVTFATDKSTVILAVNQAAPPPKVEATGAASWQSTWQGQNQTLAYTTSNVTADVGCGVTTGAAWLTVSDATFDAAKSTGSFVITAAANSNPFRVALVTVACGTARAQYVVSQEAGPYLKVSPTDPRVGDVGGPVVVQVTAATAPWTAEVTQGADWLTVSALSGTGGRLVTLQAAVNPNPGTDRQATVRFSNGFSQTDVTVTQSSSLSPALSGLLTNWGFQFGNLLQMVMNLITKLFSGLPALPALPVA